MLSRITGSLLSAGIITLGSPGILMGLMPAQRQAGLPSSVCRPSDSASVVRVAERFHRILSTGDTARIKTLLAPDLRVIEGGTVETLWEYLSHHLAADIEFAKAVKEERTSLSYRCDGNVAWLISTSNAAGKFRDRDINSAGAELLLLSRSGADWKIRAIHWSSAKRQPR